MAQTSYPLVMPIAFAGQVQNISDSVHSAGVNDSGAQLPFGVAVTLSGNGDNKYRLPAASTEKVYGFISHHHDVDILPFLGGLGSGVDIGREFSLLEEGDMAVTFEQTMVQGDPVFVRFAANGGNTQKGSVRKDADVNGTATAAAVKGAQVIQGATAGNIGVIRFNKMVNLS